MLRNTRSRTKYRAEYADQAYRYTLLGARTADLAQLFEVDEHTIKQWAKKNSDFAIALRDGGDLADANVAAALYKRATGFSRVSRSVTRGPKGRTIKTETEYYPPDTSAASRWLQKRKPEIWGDFVTDKPPAEPMDFSHLNAEQRAALRASLLEALQPPQIEKQPESLP